MTWDKINQVKDFDDMLNNWGAYHDLTITDEERAAEEAAAMSNEDLWNHLRIN